MASEVTVAIQSLARIAQASARLMAAMHYSDRLRDNKQEVEHMQANLDHVRKLLDGAS